MTGISMIVLATDVLMPLTVFSIGQSILKARQTGPTPLAIFAVLAAALVWGTARSWLPSLSALRFLPPPRGQAGAILALIVALNVLCVFPSVRRMFLSIEHSHFIDFGLWRVIYGVGLLAIGLLGGLPSAFFWSAGIGDILVGVWAITMMFRKPHLTNREITAWNLVGLLDLAHVLVLGAIHLRGFYLTHPDVAPLNLLPLVGVPLLIVMHIQSLIALRNRSKMRIAGVN